MSKHKFDQRSYASPHIKVVNNKQIANLSAAVRAALQVATIKFPHNVTREMLMSREEIRNHCQNNASKFLRFTEELRKKHYMHRSTDSSGIPLELIITELGRSVVGTENPKFLHQVSGNCKIAAITRCLDAGISKVSRGHIEVDLYAAALKIQGVLGYTKERMIEFGNAGLSDEELTRFTTIVPMYIKGTYDHMSVRAQLTPLKTDSLKARDEIIEKIKAATDMKNKEGDMPKGQGSATEYLCKLVSHFEEPHKVVNHTLMNSFQHWLMPQIHCVSVSFSSFKCKAIILAMRVRMTVM